MISSARIAWSHYKDCPFDVFLAMSQKPCYYCGRQPYRTYNASTSHSKRARYTSDDQVREGNFTYNGLDRIDSSKGHTLDNIVTCCSECNYAKLAMSQEKFLSLVEMIYLNTRKLR